MTSFMLKIVSVRACWCRSTWYNRTWSDWRRTWRWITSGYWWPSSRTIPSALRSYALYTHVLSNPRVTSSTAPSAWSYLLTRHEKSCRKSARQLVVIFLPLSAWVYIQIQVLRSNYPMKMTFTLSQRNYIVYWALYESWQNAWVRVRVRRSAFCCRGFVSLPSCSNPIHVWGYGKVQSFDCFDRCELPIPFENADRSRVYSFVGRAGHRRMISKAWSYRFAHKWWWERHGSTSTHSPLLRYYSINIIIGFFLFDQKNVHERHFSWWAGLKNWLRIKCTISIIYSTYCEAEEFIGNWSR